LTYVVSVTTGSRPAADTEADVWCRLEGEWGDAGVRRLARPTSGNKPFRVGEVGVAGIERKHHTWVKGYV
jgi:hypothetical protein